MKLIYLFLPLLISAFNLTAQTADFTYSTAATTACAPQAINFTQTSTGSPVSFLWDFGNGETSNSSSQRVVYNQPGTYTVRLIVVYANSSASVSKQITVNQTPDLALSANKTILCKPETINFTAVSNPAAASYEWNFNDGSPLLTSPTGTVSHAFTGYGDYLVKVKAITAQGCSDSAEIPVSIQKLNINATITPPRGCVPANVSFVLQTIFPPGEGLQNVLWNYGDGSPAQTTASLNSSHVFTSTTAIGNANAVITSTSGCVNNIVFDTIAYGNPPPTLEADTRLPRDTFCGSESVNFYARSAAANEFKWDFGASVVTYTRDTVTAYKFPQLGPQTIIVTALHNGCEGAKDTIRIFIKGAIANFEYANTCSNKTRYVFSNASQGTISTFKWEFSDNPSAPDIINYNTVHTFPPAGNFNTTLYLVDNSTGCRDSITKYIFTAQPVLNVNKTAVCKDSLLVYTVESSYPAGAGYQYKYHVTGSNYEAGNSSIYNHHPPAHGTYNDFVVIYDEYPGTCDDTIYLSTAITVRGPLPDFDSDISNCQDTAVRMINLSQSYFPSDAIDTWLWEFGDNYTDSVKDPAPHLYRERGDYLITLTATDVNGCSQSISKAVNIRPIPIVHILPPIDTLCRGESTTLIAYSIDSVRWIPATGLNCANCDTVIANPSNTTNYIAETINSVGCRSIDSTYIRVFAPFDLQVTPGSVFICPGTSVTLNTNVPGIPLWSPPNFLDNPNSQSPVSTPTESIRYKVAITDSAGCFTDSAFASINLYPAATVDAGPDQDLPYNSSFFISPVYSNNISGYYWSPAININCIDCPAPSGTAVSSQTYQVDITDVNGCKASDQVKIIVRCESSNLLLPNAFTPNKDGLNDYFYPITRGYRSIKRFAIFDRNGFKVFERQGIPPNQRELGWDGKIRSAPSSNTQAFTWFVEAECESGEMIFTKGTVILIR